MKVIVTYIETFWMYEYAEVSNISYDSVAKTVKITHKNGEATHDVAKILISVGFN